MIELKRKIIVKFENGIRVSDIAVEQGGIKYHFLSLLYDSTWDWTPVSRAIVEYYTQLANIIGPGAALLNTQHYKVRIKGKVEQLREWSRALPYTSV